MGVIDALLQDDKQRPAKQKHTAKRIPEENVAAGSVALSPEVAVELSNWMLLPNKDYCENLELKRWCAPLRAQ